MNEYTYEEIETGHIESFTVTITEEMMDSFCAITGDTNPLHCDGEYAGSKGYRGRVVYGMLTGSLLSTLAGVYLPGKRSLIQEVTIKFAKPVYIGDTLTVEGVVEEKNDTFSLLMIKATIRNSSGEKVCRAKMQVGVNG
ncbi:MAG: MaoC family dehydratase [Lachnospiraceae bacterium]|nr:MaoC family dehydratase [Lachnospiraceae bacterium]